MFFSNKVHMAFWLNFVILLLSIQASLTILMNLDGSHILQNFWGSLKDMFTRFDWVYYTQDKWYFLLYAAFLAVLIIIIVRLWRYVAIAFIVIAFILLIDFMYLYFNNALYGTSLITAAILLVATINAWLLGRSAKLL